MVSRPADRLLSPGAHRPMATPPPTATKPRAEPEAPVSMIVRDVEMSFGSMVVFIIKWTLASIPALIILFVIGLVLASMFGGLIAGSRG